jgi:soluble lytic murein transglycosylase-like protein
MSRSTAADVVLFSCGHAAKSARLSVLLAIAGAFAASATARTAADQPLRDSTATIHNIAPPVPAFIRTEDRLTYLRWLTETDKKLAPFAPDAATRKEIAQTTWYEAKRAGLDVGLVLGSIEALSGFRKYAVAPNGAMGYMAVNPAWVSKIGNGDVSTLMHLQTNLRFGCVLLRHYLDGSKGNVHTAVTKYVENNLGLAPGNPQVAAVVNNAFAAQARWAYIDQAK